ncbi:MAG: hypothetical protein KBF75_14995 [Saprospiraceae bacterium]|nr:hypothetical protein [Saprospiraceae bacterium]
MSHFRTHLKGYLQCLTIFISCLGLIGLVIYMAASRTKELGVRKILGASVSNIVTILSKDFSGLICIAFVIASPLVYWLMNKWLSDYTYRVDIKWWVFGLAGVSILLIALMTVSVQAFRAVLANPGRALRTE